MEGSNEIFDFLTRERDYQTSLLAFLSGAFTDSAGVFSSSACFPPFTNIIAFDFKRTTLDSLLANLGGSDVLNDLNATRASSGASECCIAPFVLDFNGFCRSGVSYLLLGAGLVLPERDFLRSLRQGFFYIPERGKFSVHDSFLSLVLDELEDSERVYPILDEVSDLSSHRLEFDNLVCLLDSGYSEVIAKSNLVLCSKCGKPYRQDVSGTKVKFTEVLNSSRELFFLELIGWANLDLDSVSKIRDEEYLRYLHLAFQLFYADGPIALVAVLRTLRQPYRRSLRKLISFLRGEGAEIFIEDSSVISRIKRPRESSVRYISPYSVSLSELQVDLRLNNSLLAEQQARVRADTSVGSYIGILSVLRNFYILHPVAKMRGIGASDLNFSSSRFLCESCKGVGCKSCYETGFSSYLDDIEMQGIGFRSLLGLDLRQIFKTFSYVKDVSKLASYYSALPVLHLKLNQKVRELNLTEYALLILIKDGLPILKKGGVLLLENILTPLSINEISLLRDFLDKICKKTNGRVLIADKSQFPRVLLPRDK